MNNISSKDLKNDSSGIYIKLYYNNDEELDLRVHQQLKFSNSDDNNGEIVIIIAVAA
jgi:hypothetical protein